MNRFLKIFVALIASCLPALAQAPIHQSGNATPGHALYFVTNGIAGDAGTAVNGFLTSLGVTASGDAMCQNSAGPTSAGWQRICFGVTTAAGADITVQNFGTATAQPLTLNLNGTAYQFPFTLPGTGIIGPNTTVVGDIGVWNNITGTLLKDTPPLQIFGTESANTVLAGPTTGSAANPTFRALVTADVPAIPSSALDGLCATNNNFLIRLSGTWQCGATGTSGHAVPFLDGANAWSSVQTFNSNISISGAALLPNVQGTGTTYATWRLEGGGSANGAYLFQNGSGAGLFPVGTLWAGLINNETTNGGTVIGSNGGAHIWDYPSGGIYVGASPSDPGTNNETIQGNLIVSGSINASAIGNTSPSTGKFTTINASSQITSTAGLPTIASGACGATTNGAVVSGSTNQSGSITIGSATTTSCTISWSATLAVAPNACVFFPMNAAAGATGTTVARSAAPTTGGVVLTGSALANANYGYVCL